MSKEYREQLKGEFQSELDTLLPVLQDFIEKIQNREYKLLMIYRKINNDDFYKSLKNDDFGINYLDKLDTLIYYVFRDLFKNNLPKPLSCNLLNLLVFEIDNLLLWLKWCLKEWSMISWNAILRMMMERILALIVILEDTTCIDEKCSDYARYWLYYLNNWGDLKQNAVPLKYQVNYFHQIYFPKLSISKVMNKYNLNNYSLRSYFIHWWLGTKNFLKMEDLMNPKSDAFAMKSIIHEAIALIRRMFKEMKEHIVGYAVIDKYLYYLEVSLLVEHIDEFDDEVCRDIEKKMKS